MAGELARALGAEALLIFLFDAAVDTLVPAAGFPQTLPGGPRWRALLDACRQPGQHVGSVEFPDRASEARAQALVTERGLALVLIGPSPRMPDPLELALPLLEATLFAEAEIATGQGRLAAEREASLHATALAGALDVARQELESTLAETGRLNGKLEAAAAERAQLLESERAANQSKDEFLAMLGHELRNPLAPILTALQLLKMRSAKPLGREYSVIDRQVRHLAHLVDDLLDISRITRGTVTLERQLLELSGVVEKAVEMTSPLLESRQHRLSIEVPSKGLLLHADERRMAQIISNLLTNAARYTPPGGQISIRAALQDERVRLVVKDDGIGLEPSMLENIFGLFVQGNRSKARTDGGLGLGLAIVKSLINLHEGTVTARSEGAGRGSEFTIELPAASTTAADEPLAEQLRVEPGRRGEGVRVLVVDDNTDAAELLGEALQEHGYEIAVCHDGAAALEVSQRFLPDAAILDIGLPVMDGLELGRRLRQDPRLADTLLIAATGYGQQADRQLSGEAGFNKHLVKPLSLTDVLDALGELPVRTDGPSRFREQA